MHAEITGDALSIDAVVARVAHGGAGGIDVFVGAVRDANDGRPVVLLEYEAYASMALAEMRRIGEAIERATPGVRVAAAHRVGALRVGDLAVVCAASAPHRAEAFAAWDAETGVSPQELPLPPDLTPGELQ